MTSYIIPTYNWHKLSDTASHEWGGTKTKYTLHKVKKFVELSHISCSLTFCSLGRNQISNIGSCELAAALQVNQSLQELKWVKPFCLTSAMTGPYHAYRERGVVTLVNVSKLILTPLHYHFYRYRGDMFCYLLFSYLTFCRKALAIQRV